MRIFERWYFGLCWNLRLVIRVIISWRILVSFRGLFWRLYFCMVRYLSFHNSSFCLQMLFKVFGQALFWRLYFCMMKYLSFHNSSFGPQKLFLKSIWQGHNVTHPLFIFGFKWLLVLTWLFSVLWKLKSRIK